MNIKLNLTVVAAILSLLLFSCKDSGEKSENVQEVNTETSGTFVLNLDNSVVNWEGNMIGLYGHTGTLDFIEGELTLEGEKVVSGNFKVDMNSMKTTDPDANYGGAPREKLIQHLQSDDFFATDKFPIAEFEIKEQTAKGLVGTFTVRGVSNEETVTDLVLNEEDGVVTATGVLVFDRQKYDVAYKSAMKDKVLSDDIKIQINLRAELVK